MLAAIRRGLPSILYAARFPCWLVALSRRSSERPWLWLDAWLCSRAGTSFTRAHVPLHASFSILLALAFNRQRVFPSLFLPRSSPVSLFPLSLLSSFPLFPVNSSFSFPSRLSFRLSASLPIRAVALANRGKLKRASEHCSLRLWLASSACQPRGNENDQSWDYSVAPSQFWPDQNTQFFPFRFPFPRWTLCEST